MFAELSSTISNFFSGGTGEGDEEGEAKTEEESAPETEKVSTGRSLGGKG